MIIKTLGLNAKPPVQNRLLREILLDASNVEWTIDRRMYVMGKRQFQEFGEEVGDGDDAKDRNESQRGSSRE